MQWRDQISIFGHATNGKGVRLLASRGEGAGATRRDASRRRERAHRILDAAAELILRWGYNKTTIDDIARQARVAKGTIYLHWKTREELFMALMRREQLHMSEDLRRRIAEDHDGATLRGIVKHSTLAVMKRPLLKAVLLRDIDVIGKLAYGEHATAASAQRLAGFEAYLQLLRDHDMIRSDLGLREQLYIVSAIVTGFLLVRPMLPQRLAMSDEETAEFMADTVHRTLEVGRAVSPEELQTVSNSLLHYLAHSAKVAEEQFEQGLGS